MNSRCFNVIIAVVFLQVCTWVVGEEDFSQFEEQFKQLNEALSGGGAGDVNGTASLGIPKDEPAAAAGNPVEQPAADQPAVEPTRPPKPEEGSTFPPLSRNGTTEPPTTPPPTKATTPKGDGGADFCGANIALVFGVACVLHLLY